MGTVALHLEGAAKNYHRNGREEPVFDSIDLSVQEGEVFALLGPSGCGKSTLLRTVAGLEPLTAGKVEVGNGHQSGRTVGIVFQDALLLPWLTVAENVALGLGYGANRHAGDRESVEQILYEFGLSQVARSYPDELSGGQAQRASLARTLVTRPKIILLDEPFASLDPRTRAALQDWLLEIARQRGLTVVVVTHDVEEAIYLGDRVGLMSLQPGRLTHVWDVGRSPNRERAQQQAQEIRREILLRYQSDLPLTSSPPRLN